MNCAGIVLFVLAIADAVFGKVTLQQGVNQTVTFEGEELEIVADSSHEKAITICFGSKPDESNEYCPKGYAAYVIAFNAKIKKHVLKIDRQGEFTEDSSSRIIVGPIKFNDDGSLNVLVHKLPTGATVVLPHAKKWAPKEPEIGDIKEKKVVKSGSTPYNVIGCCFLLILLAIGFIVYLCVIRKKKHLKPAIPFSPPDGVSDESIDAPYVPTSSIVIPRSKKLIFKRSSVTPATKCDVNSRKHQSRTTKSSR